MSGAPEAEAVARQHLRWGWTMLALFAALGPGFSRKGSRREVHRTPGGVAQRFVYVVAQREG